jgi:cytochrome c553
VNVGFRNAGAAALAAALCFLAASPVLAADPQLCAACHGPEGNSILPANPSLAAQPEQFVSIQLYQFREGNRKDAQMTPMAANLSNKEMNELAAYFSKQKAVAPLHKTSPESAAAGPKLAQQLNCVQCHGPTLRGQEHIPRLAGQQHEYLLAQLRKFKARTRGDFDGFMTQIAQPLSDKEIEILADYLAGLNPQ